MLLRASIFFLLLAAPARADDLATLVEWMTGSFSSGAQATSDDQYYDIRLEMVPIWTDRKDGPWLYVEQAVASSPDAPYRQRVYRVTHPDREHFTSEVFELPDPRRFVGAHWDPDRFDALAPDQLTLREGCTVVLERQGNGTFAGSTDGAGCLSSLRGATYATSIVTIGPDGIESWDRGFDAEGQQVWGAEAGPYVFRRAGRIGD